MHEHEIIHVPVQYMHKETTNDVKMSHLNPPFFKVPTGLGYAHVGKAVYRTTVKVRWDHIYILIHTLNNFKFTVLYTYI